MIGGRERHGMRRALIVAFLVAVVVGATRVWLGEHSVAEVVVGGVVGVLGAAIFADAGAGEAADAAPVRPLLGAAVVVMLTLHGAHFTLESSIRAASAQAVRDWFSPGQ